MTDFDQITVAELQRIGGSKWSRHGDALGAFIAEMDFGLAPPITAALHAMVADGVSGYLSPAWTSRLRQATTAFLDRRYGWQVDPDRVVLGPDVLTAMTIMVDDLPPGGRVVVPTPAYMPFLTMPGVLGRELVQLPMLRTEQGWALDERALAHTLTERDLFVLCNPHNPIGKAYSPDELTRLAAIVERAGARVFNDEIHAPLTMPGVVHTPYPTVSPAAAAHSLTATSASKAWNLAGYKCSQYVVNDADADLAARYPFRLDTTATPGVIAATAAYEQGEPWLAEVIDYLAGNQRRLVELVAEELPGVRMLPNEATYLAWLDCRELDIEGPLAPFFLEHANVALTDGASCGEVGAGAVRLNFACPRPVLEQLVRQMGEALRRR